VGHKLNSPLISSRVLNYNTVAVSQLARVVSTLHVPQSRLGRGNPPDLLWGLLAGNMQGLMNWVVSLCHGAAARLRHEHTRRARGTGLYCEHSYADVIVYSRLLHELHYTIHWGRETRCRNRILQAQLTLVRLSASPATKQVCRQLLNREKSSQSIPRKANNESQSSTKHQNPSHSSSGDPAGGNPLTSALHPNRQNTHYNRIMKLAMHDEQECTITAQL